MDWVSHFWVILVFKIWKQMGKKFPSKKYPRSKHMSTDHQNEILYAGGYFYDLPKHLPGRVNTDDFVYFVIPPTINAAEYAVVVQTLDTSGPTSWRKLKLAKTVELPFIHYDAYAGIGVVPLRDPRKPSFYSRLNRGSTYTIPSVTQPGRYEMLRSGMLTAGASL